MTQSYVRYSDGVEQIGAHESELFDKIVAAMRKGGDITRKKYGRAVRTSRAKAHGLVRGELVVHDGLAPELRQGLFAQARSYPVVVRLAHVPGELLDDRKVSTPRGMAIKVLEVDGPMLEAGEGAAQDFVLDTGKVFIAANADVFLGQIAATEMSAALPEALKSVVSALSHATNVALHAVGADSANMDFYGHPKLHPLAEPYFSQIPFRYGDYIAKLGVFPTTPGMKRLLDETVRLEDENGLRTAVVDFFRVQPAEFTVAIQLCTDLSRMPVENAHAEWSEEESPFRPVATLRLPPQDAYDAQAPALDEDLSFCPSHSLGTRRPLGSIGRARMQAYPIMAAARRAANGRSTAEPRTLAGVGG